MEFNFMTIKKYLINLIQFNVLKNYNASEKALTSEFETPSVKKCSILVMKRTKGIRRIIGEINSQSSKPHSMPKRFVILYTTLI